MNVSTPGCTSAWSTTDEYRAMNPNGMIPVIDDDGFVLWESNATCATCALWHAKAPFWPADLRVRASADRWLDGAETPSARRVVPLHAIDPPA